jgi:hypothetical protein
MLSPLLTLILSGFSLAVANSWFRYHILATGDHWFWIAFPLIAYSVVAGGVVFLWSRSKAPLRISPLFSLALLIAALFIIFNTQVFLRPMFLTGTPLLAGRGMLAANLAFGKMAVSILALFCSLTLLFVSTGGLTVRLARFSRSILAA